MKVNKNYRSSLLRWGLSFFPPLGGKYLLWELLRFSHRLGLYHMLAIAVREVVTYISYSRFYSRESKLMPVWQLVLNKLINSWILLNLFKLFEMLKWWRFLFPFCQPTDTGQKHNTMLISTVADEFCSEIIDFVTEKNFMRS